MQKRVLFADNLEKFVGVRSEFLTSSGYVVIPAYSAKEAANLLENERIHLALLDIRLDDDNDDRDESGLKLAKDKAYASVPKIMLTQFPTYEAVREALGRSIDQLPPAVFFLDKKEGPQAMMKAVNDSFAGYVRINWNLLIRWLGKDTFGTLRQQIDPEVGEQAAAVRTEELEDLFRRLFYDSVQITIGRQFSQHEGHIILEVMAFGENGPEGQFVVSCGLKQQVRQEDIQHELFILEKTKVGSTALWQSVETVHYAATAYQLIGGELDEVVPLRKLHAQTTQENILKTVIHLYNRNLASLHKQEPVEREKTLADLWAEWPWPGRKGLSQLAIAAKLEAIAQQMGRFQFGQIDYSAPRLSIRRWDGPTVSYHDPVSYLFNGADALQFKLPYGVTHGQVDGERVLVNQKGQSWLVDFSKTGANQPLVLDFVLLEMMIKFQWFRTKSLRSRYELENHLLAAWPVYLAEQDEAVFDEESQKVLSVIGQVRRLAAAALGPDMTAYQLGLFLSTMNWLCGYDPGIQYGQRELAGYLHGLLAAAMLAQKLVDPDNNHQQLPPEALNSVWINEAEEKVWVEGQAVTLSPLEYKAFAYLYHNKEYLCTREALADAVYGSEFDPTTFVQDKIRIDQDRLNSLMSRLRKKIAAAAPQHAYIVTDRGRGYALRLKKGAGK